MQVQIVEPVPAEESALESLLHIPEDENTGNKKKQDCVSLGRRSDRFRLSRLFGEQIRA